MAKNVTYYFGAGASANAIPAIDGIRERLNLLPIYLEQKKINVDSAKENKERDLKYNSTLSYIISDLNWLYEESRNHQTIDTLAKKLYVQKNEYDLNKLKRGLLSYFFFEQHIQFDNTKGNYNELIDKRYDSLIASICEKDENDKIVLNKNVKVITWNYDLQLDLCLMDYSKLSLNKTKISYNIFPNELTYNTINSILLDKDNFGVLKLNGNAYFEANQPFANHFNFNLYDKSIMHDTEDQIIEKYLLCFESKFPKGEMKYDDSFKYLNFAWEEPGPEKYHGFKSVLNTAIEIAKKTEILIVVGYSFPFFNSDIDRAILEKMNPNEIIIQDLDCQLIEQRIISLVPKFAHKVRPFQGFVHQKVSKYFPIPNEIK